MSKIKFLLTLAALFSILSCTIPKEIEIKGSLPELKYSANLNVNEMLLDMIGEALGGDSGMDIKILDFPASAACQAYLIHINAIEQSIELGFLDGEIEIPTTGQKIKMSEYFGGIPVIQDLLVYDTTLGQEGYGPIELPLSSIGDTLGSLDFSKDETIAKLYFNSNSGFIEDVLIEIMFIPLDDAGKEIDPGNPIYSLSMSKSSDVSLKIKPSGIDLTKDTYQYKDLPEGGVYLNGFSNILNAKKNLNVHIKVTLPAGMTVPITVLEDGAAIIAEIVVILPLKLNAPAGSEFILPLPEDFMADAGDYITAFTDVLESLSISAGMTPNNPLNGAALIIRQPGTGIEINNLLSSNSLDFSISAADMKTIRSVGSNLNPVISLGFPKNLVIGIPRDFCITTITLKANIKYSIDLSGE